jgi:hypothetical protein
MWRDERGMAMVLVLLCATVFLALGGAIVTVINTEAAISATFREGEVALAAADAAIVRVTGDLATANLDAALAGSAVSTFVDGAAGGLRRLPDGTLLDLAVATGNERCGQASCDGPQMDAVTAERPWGVNNARWQVYGAGWVSDIVPGAAAPRVYVVVWIGDDPLESDGNPLADDPAVTHAGHQTVLLRAAAYAAYSVRRTTEVVARRDNAIVRITSWREIR